MAVAPHALAAQSALAVLREGGNALEAMVAAAATIAVVYPHMNSIGGDSFWLVHVPGEPPRGIDACGAAAGAASREWYAGCGITGNIPFRGGVAANTVAGTISGWDAAFELSRELDEAATRRKSIWQIGMRLSPRPLNRGDIPRHKTRLLHVGNICQCTF